MGICLLEVTSSGDFVSAELGERFRVSPKSAKTASYRAVLEGREVAFVALDRWPELDHLVLYELFVPVGLRGKGIGSATLDAVEQYAAGGFGQSSKHLRPFPCNPIEA